MFQVLRNKFQEIICSLKKTGKIKEENTQEALHQKKIVLPDADLNYKLNRNILIKFYCDGKVRIALLFKFLTDLDIFFWEPGNKMISKTKLSLRR